MTPINLLKFNNVSLNFDLKEELGYGADGQIFSLSNDRVIKISANYSDISPFSLEHIFKVIEYIKTNKPISYAEIYDYGLLVEGKEKTYYGFREYKIYYYTLQRLNKISDDERKVFHSILCHEDMNKKKYYPIYKISDMLKGMSLGLEFDFNKVFVFYKNLLKENIYHMDIHVRNIMKDNFGNFKLIDFDRLSFLK